MREHEAKRKKTPEMSNTIATPTVPQTRYVHAIRELADFLEAHPIPASVYAALAGDEAQLDFHTHHLDHATETLIKAGGDEALYVEAADLTHVKAVRLPGRFGFDKITVFVPKEYEPVVVADCIDPQLLIEEQMAAES